MTDFRICPHLVINRNQAQCHIDDLVMCSPCTADYLEKLAKETAPADIAANIRFDQCGHNGKQPCHLCRVGVASCIALLWSYARLNGDELTGHKLARLLKRMKAKNGPLFFLGQHGHELQTN